MLSTDPDPVMDDDLLLNLRSRVLHRYPAFESCNVDAIPLNQRLHLASGEIPAGLKFRYCRRCFKAA